MGIKKMPSSWRLRAHNGNPCTPDCQRRSATCHATCKEYADFAETRRVEAEKHLIAVQSAPPFKPIK